MVAEKGGKRDYVKKMHKIGEKWKNFTIFEPCKVRC